MKGKQLILVFIIVFSFVAWMNVYEYKAISPGYIFRINNITNEVHFATGNTDWTLIEEFDELEASTKNHEGNALTVEEFLDQ